MKNKFTNECREIVNSFPAKMQPDSLGGRLIQAVDRIDALEKLIHRLLKADSPSDYFLARKETSELFLKNINLD